MDCFFQRLDRLEMKQLKTDEKVDLILDRLNRYDEISEGIFSMVRFLMRMPSLPN